MNHPIAQIVAMTCFGNATLSGYKIDTFYPSNSTFIFCNRVNFVTFYNFAFGKVIRSPDLHHGPDPEPDEYQSGRLRRMLAERILA